MKAIINIDRKDALLAGLDNEGHYTVNFNPADLTPEQRTELALSPTNNDDIWIANRENHQYYPQLITPHPNPEILHISNYITPINPDLQTLVGILDARILIRQKAIEHNKQAEAEIRTENIERVLAWISEPYRDNINSWDDSDIVWPRLKGFSFYNAGDRRKFVEQVGEKNQAVREYLEDLDALIFWRKIEADFEAAERKRSVLEARARAEAEAETEKAQRVAQIESWVMKYGDENQKERIAEGVLPEREVIDNIRNEAFKPLDNFPRYERIEKDDVCNGDYGYHDDIDFDVDDADELTAKQYTALKEIKERVGELTDHSLAPIDAVTVTPRIHTGECSECEIKISRISFMVNIQSGVFEFSREYGCDDK